MSNTRLPMISTADDQDRVEKELAQLPESADGIATDMCFCRPRPECSCSSPGWGIVHSVSMPAGDEGAHALTMLLKRVLEA